MMRVGFVGWRGMVGSVLIQRMLEEGDFEHIDPVFFSTSSAGGIGPSIGKPTTALRDANDARAFAGLDAIVTCQGGDWTKPMYGALRAAGWNGYWIDAASTLRMADDAVIILDPVNRNVIDRALDGGVKNYIGGNCTVSLMMMAIAGPAAERPRRMDDVHDLPVGIRRRRAEHARATAADGRGSPCGEGSARRPDIVDTGHRPRGCGHPAGRSLPDRAFRRAARRQPDSVDRGGHGRRGQQGGVEGRRRDQQDPRPRRPSDSRRIDLRAHRRDALPQSGSDHEATEEGSAAGDRALDRRSASSGFVSYPTRAMRARES